MALKGSLKDFGVADILQLLYFQRKTGTLSIEGRLDKVKLLFIEGNIVGAESKRRIEANRLGKVIVKRGLIQEDQLVSALAEQRKTGNKLGNILIRRRLLQKEQLQEILTSQITETVIQIFGWKQGAYDFIPQSVAPDREIPIFIDTQHLLMEGLRIVDEWSLIEGKLNLDSVFVRKSLVVTDLTTEEEELLGHIDGDNDVSSIIDISGKDDFAVSRTLVSLMEKGVVELKEIPPEVPAAPAASRINILPSYHSLLVLVFIASFIFSLIPVFVAKSPVFKKFQAAESVEDIRFAIEVYRFEKGSYPKTLDNVTTRKDPWGRNYLYNYHDNIFTVLSKGPDGKEGTEDDIY
jgi:hypothetical protein